MPRKGNDPTNPVAAALSKQKELEELGLPSDLTQSAAQLEFNTTEAQNTLRRQKDDAKPTEPDYC